MQNFIKPIYWKEWSQTKGKEFLEMFIGKEIIDLKMCTKHSMVNSEGEEFQVNTGGGLTFFLKDIETKELTRITLGYTELGEWIEDIKRY